MIDESGSHPITATSYSFFNTKISVIIGIPLLLGYNAYFAGGAVIPRSCMVRSSTSVCTLFGMLLLNCSWGCSFVKSCSLICQMLNFYLHLTFLLTNLSNLSRRSLRRSQLSHPQSRKFIEKIAMKTST